MDGKDRILELRVEMPDGMTLGDLTEVRGAIGDVAAGYVDWGEEPLTVGRVGVFLGRLADALRGE